MFGGLWEEARSKVIEYLKQAELQLTIHPIKFSNLTLQDVVNKYIFIMNEREY